ncbi:hypothetical protein NE237_007502 [Protea cynaroides]|uniref:GTD-binding domain-containing protein n=1 Tax=Protea cynaroides TaxID=273540 RepID=A0A9Q0KP96_9MAGN|nr:hypothetical protein NE237_007502 [Protea cynaroides]
MAKRSSFKQFIEQNFGKFPYFLIHSFLEWILIVMLFIDALISFAANEFAHMFELEIPCLLCTRIDHVLAYRDADFYYNDSICEAHRKDVSSLAFCHVHQKLADIRRMCEGCLLSFATEDKSDCDTYRSLVGILGKDLECSVEDDHKIHLRLPAGGKMDMLQVEKSSIHRCSCCGEALRVRASFPQGLVQNASPDVTHILQAPTPAPRGLLGKIKGEESRSSDPYTELKITSSRESGVPEDEDGSTSLTPDNQCREDVKAATVTSLEELNEDAVKTPTFAKGSRLSAIPLTESATGSPRWLHRLPRKLAIEKLELSPEFLEGNATTEVDGETTLQRLKRQVQLDRKALIALYMELDEERSASAIAANQAMAMITRLQAEKAAVQMEALQYQRMMEEQEEYDQEALQDMKDLLIKKEEEIKVLEAKLETYEGRSQHGESFGNDSYSENADEEYYQLKSPSESSVGAHCQCGSPPANIDEEVNNGEQGHNSDQSGPQLEANGPVINDESILLDFEEEKLYLLDRLKMLERRIHLPPNDGDNSNINNLNEEDKGDLSSNIITKEISRLSERLEAIEADKEFLKHAVQSLHNGGEGTQLLREISLHLRELRCAEKMLLDGVAA